MLLIAIGIIASYLIGSIPTAYLFGRVLKGVDIRKFGSGNVGATNAMRLLGKGPGIAVLFIDILKGLVAVFFLGNIIVQSSPSLSDELVRIILGFSCIIGHNWTIFLGFKGGKGVATTVGVLLGLSLKISGLKFIFILGILTWLLVFLASRIISLASVIAAICFPIYMVVFKQSKTLTFTTLVLSLFIVLRHKTNLIRILQGKEEKLSLKK